MFCSKCGKTIDDNATFCGFCGAPTNNAANAVMNGAPQQSAPQYGTPQQNAPQYGAPQYNAQPVSTGFTLNLDPKMVDIINKALRGVLALLGLLTFIGAIGTMASVGSLASGNILGAAGIQGFYYLARVTAIIGFSLSLLGAVFTFLTKQHSLFSYISCGIGIIMFIFNFVMYGGFVSFALSSYGSLKMGGIIVSGIFLIISALAMIASSVIIIMKKEDIIPFKPKF